MIWSALGAGGTSDSFLGGVSTVYPICRMGMITMKMISSTRTTSTSGVTLISERMPPPPEGPIAMARLLCRASR
jgi:hypothetical protein